MKLAGLIVGLILVALGLPFLIPAPRQPHADEHLPWQIEILPAGQSRVFGLTLPVSTLADAQRLQGTEFAVGLILDQAEGKDYALALEAYQERAQLGFVSGKLILTLRVSEDVLAGLVERSRDSQAMRSGARRIELAPADRQAVLDWPIRAITFIPAVDLDPQTVLARFGEPASRVAAEEGREHLLYPIRGLDLLLDPNGREILQYVAPAEFEALSAPLLAATAKPTSAGR